MIDSNTSPRKEEYYLIHQNMTFLFSEILEVNEKDFFLSDVTLKTLL